MQELCARYALKNRNPSNTTVVGNLIKHLHNVLTTTSDISTVKCLLNSVIYTPNESFCRADIKYFYLNTPMHTYEYMRIKASLIPEEIMKKYHLSDNIHNDHIYLEIRKGMYGLPQAGIIYYTQINRHLSTFGYKPCRYTPDLWGHETRDINFCLVVNDFGIKYTSDNNLQHIHSDLRKNYNIGGYERRYILQNYVKMGLQKTHSPTQHD